MAATGTDGGGGRATAHGRQLDTLLRGGACGLVSGGADHCGYAALVPGAGHVAARRPPRAAARESRAWLGHRRASRIALARSDSNRLPGTHATVGFLEPAVRVVQLGTGFGAGKKVEVSGD